MRDGWNVDGAEGFVYTTDWDGKPVVRDRLHWVVTEAIAAAAALGAATGRPEYEHWYRTWWDHAAALFLDRDRGSWHHQLDPHNEPSETVWEGKPDVYHAVQATLIPLLPLSPCLAPALRSWDTHRASARSSRLRGERVSDRQRGSNNAVLRRSQSPPGDAGVVAPEVEGCGKGSTQSKGSSCRSTT